MRTFFVGVFIYVNDLLTLNMDIIQSESHIALFLLVVGAVIAGIQDFNDITKEK